MRINGHVVDPRLAALMRRADWPGKRTSAAWLARFPAHPSGFEAAPPFVELIPIEIAPLESAQLGKPGLEMLLGAPSTEYPPGDVDPTAAYIIGFVHYVDAAICVDLRNPERSRITYDNLASPMTVHATAFNSIDEFVQFYLEQHGDVSPA